MESILTSIKKLLGPSAEYDYYDADIIIHINTVFMILTQLGVGPSEGFRIEDEYANWDDFISTKDKNYEAVKTYMYLKVKLVFDPPLSSAVIDVYNRNINELEWRLTHAAETNKTNQ